MADTTHMLIHGDVLISMTTLRSRAEDDEETVSTPTRRDGTSEGGGGKSRSHLRLIVIQFDFVCYHPAPYVSDKFLNTRDSDTHFIVIKAEIDLGFVSVNHAFKIMCFEYVLKRCRVIRKIHRPLRGRTMNTLPIRLYSIYIDALFTSTKIWSHPAESSFSDPKTILRALKKHLVIYSVKLCWKV